MSNKYSENYQNSKSWGGWLLVISSFIILFSFIIWAYFTEINEVSRARGQIIAASRTQVVQSSEAGILKQIFVSEGDKVDKGQLLALLNQEKSKAGYNDSLNKVAALKAALARLKAEVFGKDISFSSDLSKWPILKKAQFDLFNKRKKALTESIKNFKKTSELINKEIEIIKPLIAKGDVSTIELIKLKKQLTDIDGKIINQQNKFFEEAQAEMVRAEEELAAQIEILNERQFILSSTKLKAPLDGIVRDIPITTLGASLRSGDIVMELLPTDSELIVEAKFKPIDVSSLKIGLPADIKLDAYDFSIYGAVEGNVIYISPDGLEEKNTQSEEKTYYRVQIKIKADKLKNKKILIQPGMTVLVEVRTKKRSLLNYITKPITKTILGAFGER